MRESMNELSLLHDLVSRNEGDIVQRWLDRQFASSSFRSDRISKSELTEQARRFLGLLRQAVATGSSDIQSPAWAGTRQMLEELSVSRAQQGFSPSETALFVFSLKETLFEGLQDQLPSDAKEASALVVGANLLLDRLGLFTTEVFQRDREQVVIRQQQELME